jgi:preprotein translocase subunit YajC
MFSTPAFADVALNTVSTPSSSIPQILMLIGFGLVFYFLIWRPQVKRAKDRQALIASLIIGDVIYTTGGVVGKITKLYDIFLKIEVAPETQIYIQKEAVVEVVPKGSLKNTLNFE